MPRRQTAAAERAEQTHRLQERVKAETGEQMSIAAAAAHRRKQRSDTGVWRGTSALPPPDLAFATTDLRRVGQILGKVLDIKVARGYAQMNIQCGPEYAHLLSESVLLSGHPLLVTLDQVHADMTEEPEEE